MNRIFSFALYFIDFGRAGESRDLVVRQKQFKPMEYACYILGMKSLSLTTWFKSYSKC